MKNNRTAIRVLSAFSILLSIILIELLLRNIRNTLIESIIINLITGCFVSIVIAYIDYKDKLDEIVKYFEKEVHTYYNSLLRIEKYISKSKKKDNDLLKSINSELSMINDNAKKKRENISFYFIFPSFNNLYLKKIINDIYEVTFGIDLCMLDIYTRFDKSGKKKKINNKEVINLYEKLIKVEKCAIDEGMLSIKKFGINEYWNYYLNKFVTQNPKKETDLLDKLIKSK